MNSANFSPKNEGEKRKSNHNTTELKQADSENNAHKKVKITEEAQHLLLLKFGASLNAPFNFKFKGSIKDRLASSSHLDLLRKQTGNSAPTPLQNTSNNLVNNKNTNTMRNTNHDKSKTARNPSNIQLNHNIFSPKNFFKKPTTTTVNEMFIPPIIIQSAFEQMLSGNVTKKMLSNLAKQVGFFCNKFDSQIANYFYQFSKEVNAIEMHEGESNLLSFTVKNKFIKLVNEHVLEKLNKSLYSLLKHLFNTIEKDFSELVIFCKLGTIEAKPIKKKTSSNNNSSKNKGDAIYDEACGILNQSFLSITTPYHVSLQHYCQGIAKLLLAAEAYDHDSMEKSKLETLSSIGGCLEKIADEINDMIDKSSYHLHPLAKIAYLKLALYFYQQSIMLKHTLKEKCDFNLYLSPLLIYYQLSEKYHSVNTEEYMKLIHEYINQYEIIKIAGQLTDKDQKKEFDEYMEILKNYMSDNISLSIKP